MKTTINAYLNFNGNCREAMSFYQTCFGGELTLQTVEDSPMSGQWPAQAQQNVLHASLVSNDLVLLGSDVGGPDHLIDGNSVSLSITCSSQQEIETFFANLSEGAKSIMPLHNFFAGIMGHLTDKYGKNWMFYYNSSNN